MNSTKRPARHVATITFDMPDGSGYVRDLTSDDFAQDTVSIAAMKLKAYRDMMLDDTLSINDMYAAEDAGMTSNWETK